MRDSAGPGSGAPSRRIKKEDKSYTVDHNNERGTVSASGEGFERADL